MTGQLLIKNLESNKVNQAEIVDFLKKIIRKPDLKNFDLTKEIRYALKSLHKEYAILNPGKEPNVDRVILNTIIEDPLMEAIDLIARSKSIANSDLMIKIIQENLEIQRQQIELSKVEILKRRNVKEVLKVVYNKLSH